MPADHMYYHSKIARQNLYRPDVLEKLRKIRQSKEYRQKISKTMSAYIKENSCCLWLTIVAR